MLYYLIDYLEQMYQPPGFQVIPFITVRASLAALTALFISMVVGRGIINWLSRKQLGEQVREGEGAGAVSHAHKAGTPTMGGIIILMAILVSTLLWGAIAEVYVWLALLATAWMGVTGFADDYIKTVKKNKEGLPPRVKIFAQVGIGVIVGGVLYFHPQFSEVNTLTSLPFVKDKVIDYYFFEGWFGAVDLGDGVEDLELVRPPVGEHRGARAERHLAHHVGVGRDPAIAGLGQRRRHPLEGVHHSPVSSNSACSRRTCARRPGCCERRRRSASTMFFSLSSVVSRSSLTRT